MAQEGRGEIVGLPPGLGDGIVFRLRCHRHLDRNILGPMPDDVSELRRDAHEIDAGEVGQVRHAPDILAEHMRAEFESERIGQCVFEDEFLFDRIVDARARCRRSRWSRIRATGRPSRRRPRPRGSRTGFWCRAHRRDCAACPAFGVSSSSRRREGGGASDCERDGKEAKSTGAGTVSAQDASPSILGPSSGECEAERKTALYRRARSLETIPGACAPEIRLN